MCNWCPWRSRWWWPGIVLVTPQSRAAANRCIQDRRAAPVPIRKKGGYIDDSDLHNYKGGEVKPDFTKTLADFAKTTPWLNRLNSNLFFGGEATFKAVRLEVNGKPVSPGEPTGKKAAATDGTENQFFSLAGQAGLPKYLKCDLKALADEEGIRGGEVRTVDTDYFKKDFVLDLIVQFKAGDQSSALIGIGENGRDGGWLVNSIVCDIRAPGARWGGGQASFWLHRNGEKQLIGEFKTAGPHLFRFAKKGNALTTAICANYKGGAVKPDFTKTLPDFATATPWLNRLNSSLFFGGEATFKAVRLEVNGKPVSPGEPTGKKAAATDGTENLLIIVQSQAAPRLSSVERESARTLRASCRP